MCLLKLHKRRHENSIYFTRENMVCFPKPGHKCVLFIQNCSYATTGSYLSTYVATYMYLGSYTCIHVHKQNIHIAIYSYLFFNSKINTYAICNSSLITFYGTYTASI